MEARIGDRITVRGHQVGEADRVGIVVGTRSPDGRPPFVVRWADGHEALLFPGSDAVIEAPPRS